MAEMKIEKSEIAEMVAAAVAAALKHSNTGTADAIQAAIKGSRTDTTGLSPDQIARLEGKKAPKRWREVPCRSEQTGATFLACCTESAVHPNGRITGIKNYTHPRGISTFKANGGLVPDGLQILLAGVAAPPEDGPPLMTQDMTRDYLDWRYKEFSMLDLRHYGSGKLGLQSHHTIDPAAFATPWQEGKAWSDEEAASP